FFFSSRRRHTRSTRDWSSDVCSSDLAVVVDAEVTVSDEVNNHSFTTRTDQQGRYKVEGLSAGIYTLVVSAKGFSEGRKEAVKVRSEERRVGKEGGCRGSRDDGRKNEG